MSRKPRKIKTAAETRAWVIELVNQPPKMVGVTAGAHKGEAWGVAVLHHYVKNGQATASPGQWLIDDVARERAEFELRQVSPKPLSAINAAPGAGVGLHSSDDTRAGADKRRSEDVTSSIGTPRVENGGAGAPPLQRALKRSDGVPPRPDVSHGLADYPTECIEAPIGRAPEGEHWYYRLDREAHQKCWYVRAFKKDRAEPSVVDRGLSERTSPDPSEPNSPGLSELNSPGLSEFNSPDPFDSIFWAWWHGR
jgi:hypothetical protein